LLKREIVVVLANPAAVFSPSALLKAVQVVQLQPSSIDCTPGVCVVRTFDPILQRHVDLLRLLLGSLAASISDIRFFVDTTFSMSLSDSMAWDQVALVLSESGISFSSLTSTDAAMRNWSVSSYSDISSSLLAQLQNIPLVNGVSAEALTPSPMPALPVGMYEGTVTISVSASIAGALQSANITAYSNLTCFASLSFDNAVDCAYLVPQPLADEQLLQLLNFSGMYAATSARVVTVEREFRRSMIRDISVLAGMSSQQLVIASLDLMLGQTVVYITPSGGFDLRNTNGTMWKDSFRVQGFTSISTDNATAILQRCGINATAVSVLNGTHYFFSFCNLILMQARLSSSRPPPSPRLTLLLCVQIPL